MQLAQRIRNLPLKKIGLWAAGIFVAIGIVGFFAVPPAVKAIAGKVLWDKFHRKAAIEHIGFNPYDMTLTVKGFTLTERDGTTRAASVGGLFLNLDIMSLFRWGVVVREIKVSRPYVRLVRHADNSYNIGDIVAEVLKPSEKPPARFAISNIQVEGGEIVFDDQLKQGRHTVRELTLGVPFVSNLPDDAEIFVQPRLAALVNGQKVALEGKTRPFKKTRESEVDIQVAGMNIPRYLAYLPAPLPVQLPSAFVDADLAVIFAMDPDKGNTIRVSGTMAVKKLEVRERSGKPLFALPRAGMNIASFDVVNRNAHIAGIEIEGPELSVSRAHSGEVNLLGLAPAAPDEGAAKPAQGTPFKFRVDSLRLVNGMVHFADAVPARGFRTDLKDIALTVTSLSNGDKPATVELSFATDADETVHHSGSVTLAPLAADGVVELTGFRIKRYAPYYEQLAPVEVDDGVVGLKTRYRFAVREGGFDALASELSASLKDLALRARASRSPFFRLASLSVEGAEVDPGKHSVTVADIRLSGGQAQAVREADGKIDLAKLAPSAGVPRQAPAPAGQPWQVFVKRLAVERLGARFEDKAVAQPVTHALDVASMTVSNFSTARGAKSPVALKAALNKTGRLAASGSLGLDPMTAYLKLDVQGVDSVALQPYFADKVNVTVTRGEVSASGTLTAAQKPDKSFKAGYAGTATIGKFHTVDNVISEDLLKWESLHFSGVVANHNPFSLAVEEIALTDFYARVIISKEGKLNLAGIVKRPGAAAEPAQDSGAEEGAAQPPASTDAAATPAKAPPPVAATPEGQAGSGVPIRIAAITLQAGNVNFTDDFIQPNYSANLNNLGGRVTGLSSDAGVLADVDVRGLFDNTAPLDIRGKVNPLANNLFLDIQGSVKDFELSPTTPYAAKYAGYAIDKGKLSLDVKYRVENRKLSAQNRLFLNQLTFGEKVESPTATKLPVLLAVALLKDRNGNIDINLPISGTLDDPKFSVGGIVVRLIVNLIVKAITSPFALLGSLFGGGGEELSYAEFDYGRFAVTAATETKLKSLAKALYERPALKLDIAGRVDEERDREGLRQYRLEQQIKAAKLKDLVRQGQSVGSVDDVKIEQGEYTKYLTAAYKDARFPKPRNFIGIAKDLPVPEMEKLMLANAVVSDDDLRGLATARANAVKDFLLKTGQVTADRVFVVAAKAERDKAQEKARDSRVDFALK